MTAKLILFSAMYLSLPMMYVMLRNNAAAKKSLVLSVTLPPAALRDPEVLDYCERFRKNLLLLCLGLTALLAPCMFIPWMSVAVTASMVWLLVMMGALFFFYGKSYKGLMAMKRRRGWVTAAAGQTVVEVAPVEAPKAVRPRWFVPPMILSVLPVLSCILDDLNPAYEAMLLTTAIMCLLITAMGLVFDGIAYRQRADAVDNDRDLTAALTRIRRYNWNKFWLLMVWASAFYSLAVWLSYESMTWYLIWTLVYSAVLLAASISTEFATRRGQRKVTENRTTAPQVDEDEYWLWGQFYYNPNNNRLMVNERVGMGMSMNLAHPAGKVLYGFSLLLLLAMPLSGVWMMAEEFTPVTMLLTEEAVVMEHTSQAYRVELCQVEQAEILTELPETYKISGSAMDTVYKGSFSVEGYGEAKLCLDPRAGEFLVLETGEKTYVFSGASGQAGEVLKALELEKN